MTFELKPYNRDISDNELLADLLIVAEKLHQKSLGIRDYDKYGKYHSGTISRRFNGWNSALKNAGLEINQISSVTDEELIEDLKRVENLINPKKVTQKTYNEFGKFSSTTINERFKWNIALEKAGLNISLVQNITEEDLFKNLEHVWVALGGQPGRRDMIKPNSKYSERPYLNKYGTWRKALEAFIGHINIDKKPTPSIVENEVFIEKKDTSLKHQTKRDISERLKVKVLIRDGNKCRLCGKTVTGDDIHFDHIMPWSKGGETVFENIQVLCAPHNLAKGDYYEET
jgi:hypothetical protein